MTPALPIGLGLRGSRRLSAVEWHLTLVQRNLLRAIRAGHADRAAQHARAAWHLAHDLYRLAAQEGFMDPPMDQ